MCWIRAVIYLSKPLEHRTPRVNCNLTMDLGWLRIVSVGSSAVTNVPSGGDVGNGGGCVCVKAGGLWELYILFLPQFCFEPKTALKK